jgi:sarcosine oxidase subunit beta
MRKFSAWALLREAFAGQQGWQPQWRRAEPRPEYDAVIVGGGGHGLAAAYYLAAEHGMTRVAVVEKGWIGGGNTGRNTTIIRSNYLFDESAQLYDHAVKMWRDLSQVLNYNVMYSPRGVLMLAHNVHDVQVFKRHITPIVAAVSTTSGSIPRRRKRSARHSTSNATSAIRSWERRCSVARHGRHDAVAWGYARAADALGVDIVENCEVSACVATRRAPSQRSRPRADSSAPGVSACRPPAARAWSWVSRTCACRSRVSRCRRWCPSPSSQ